MMNAHSNSGWHKDGEKWFCLTLAMQQDERERNEKEMILPGPDEVKAARLEIDFSQERAARLVHSTAAA
jgi:hypothetical protein